MQCSFKDPNGPKVIDYAFYELSDWIKVVLFGQREVVTEDSYRF